MARIGGRIPREVGAGLGKGEGKWSKSGWNKKQIFKWINKGKKLSFGK